MHYSSEYATHADDIGAPVAPGEEPGRTAWRVSFGRYALDEQNSPAKVLPGRYTMTVQLGDVTAELTAEDFVEATVGQAAGRLPPRPRPPRHPPLPCLVTPRAARRARPCLHRRCITVMTAAYCKVYTLQYA